MIAAPIAKTGSRSKSAGNRLQDWLVVCYIVFLPVQIKSPMGLRFAPSDLFLLLWVALLALGMARYHGSKWSWSGWHFMMLLTFGIATLVSILRLGYIEDKTLLAKTLGVVTLFVGYAMIVGQAYSWSRVDWLVRTLILGVAIQNAAAILSFVSYMYTGIGIPGMNYFGLRLSGFLIDPNAYGGLLVVTLALHMVTQYGGRPLVSRKLGGLISVSLVIGVLLTYSRSAWLGLAGCVAMVVVLRPRMAIYVVLIGLLGFAAIVGTLGTGYLQSMAQMSSREAQIDSRVVLIQDAIPLFWESPAFGIGLGVYAERYNAIIHNTPIWILTECGIFGFIIFCGFAAWFIRKGVAAYRLAGKTQKPLVLGATAAYIAMLGFSMGIEAFYQRHWWFVMALVGASYSLARKDR